MFLRLELFKFLYFSYLEQLLDDMYQTKERDDKKRLKWIKSLGILPKATEGKN